jgi:hypothetical protein
VASPFRVTWIQRIFFCLTCALALGLFGFVLTAPLLVGTMPGGPGWERLAAVFAGDVALRRTGLACAAGLLVTACVFFRPPPSFRALNRRPRKLRPPPPPRVAGA